MSKSYIDKILLKPKKYNPYSHMKPAVKDNNFFFINCISCNMMENFTQFKNKEISSVKLNLRLIGNLSFLFANKKTTIKKNKEKEKSKSNKRNKKNLKNNINSTDENIFGIIDGYECYIPTKRIPYFNKRALNEKSSSKKDISKNNKKIHKEIKIPPNLIGINLFRPSGRFVSIHISNSKTVKSARKKSSMSLTSNNYSEALSNNSIAYTNTNTNIDDNDGMDSSGEYSLICGEFDDNIFHEKSFVNLLRTSVTFPKYSELVEYIECPLDDPYPPDLKYKNYLNIFNEFMNEDNIDDYISNNNSSNNNNLIPNNNENFFSNNITITSSIEYNSTINLSEDTNDGNNDNNNDSNPQKIFIINPSNFKPDINNLEKSKIPRKPSKSGKLIKINTNIFSNSNTSIINKTSLSDDMEESDGYAKGESLFSFFEDENEKKNPSKKIDYKIRKILPKSAAKYINKMNNQYIFLMYEKYKLFSEKWEISKSFLYDEIMIKKLIIQFLKSFLLDIGITSKKFFDRLIKFEIHSKETLNFEHFMSIFDIILMENNKENLRFKFLLLLKIIAQSDDNEQILEEKQMNIFFDLIGCERIYINNFCEILGERLILRYKAIYNNENLDKNKAEKKFIYRKMKIILESFLDALDT